MPTLSELWRYPIKSLRGNRHQQLEIGQRGFQWDRHWMLVDEDGRFITQRQEHSLCLIDTRIEGNTLFVSAPDKLELQIPLGETPDTEKLVSIWRDQCEASIASDDINQWFSEYLGRTCSLTHLAADKTRPVDQDYANPEDEVGFADGFPFLLISQASLDDLNSRLESPVDMVRFRPNLVVDGCEAFAEDRWKRIRIGEIEFRVVKPCSRCIIPTINPQTAERSPEPFRTLASYRKIENKVYFGQNLIQDSQGTLELGMSVEILE